MRRPRRLLCLCSRRFAVRDSAGQGVGGATGTFTVIRCEAARRRGDPSGSASEPALPTQSRRARLRVRARAVRWVHAGLAWHVADELANDRGAVASSGYSPRCFSIRLGATVRGQHPQAHGPRTLRTEFGFTRLCRMSQPLRTRGANLAQRTTAIVLVTTDVDTIRRELSPRDRCGAVEASHAETWSLTCTVSLVCPDRSLHPLCPVIAFAR